MSLKTCLIVPTFSIDSSKIIDTLIVQLNQQSLQSCDLIVINNNTSPITLTHSLEKGEVFILNGRKNLGSAGGFYLGMKYAFNSGYDFYFLGDDDAVLCEQTAMESLIATALSQNDTIPYPYWKNKLDTLGRKIPASMSCYGCISHKIISKLGFYSPFFFYGGEDGAYGIMASWKGVHFELDDVSFMHPMKTWLTQSRGSSGLSVFRHNSILVHFWIIGHAPYLKLKLQSSLLIIIYLTTVLYGMILFTKYFRSQFYYNLYNILTYIPPIITGKLNWGYPIYRNSSKDNDFEVNKTNQVDEISVEECVCRISGKNSLVIDSWFPNIILGKWKLFKTVIFSNKISLLHGRNKDKSELYIKPLVVFTGFCSKGITYIICIILFPLVLTISFMIYILLLIKYVLIGIYMNMREDTLFLEYTK